MLLARPLKVGVAIRNHHPSKWKKYCTTCRSYPYEGKHGETWYADYDADSQSGDEHYIDSLADGWRKPAWWRVGVAASVCCWVGGGLPVAYWLKRRANPTHA